MIVGIAQIELTLPGAHSLKDKRRIVRSILKRTQARANVSIAEVDHQDLWQRTSIGVSCVSRSSYHARKLLREIARDIRSMPDVNFLGEHVGMVDLEDVTD